MLAGGRPIIGFPRLDNDPGEMGRSLANVRKNLLRRSAVLPVLEFNLHRTDDIFGDVLALRRATSARV